MKTGRLPWTKWFFQDWQRDPGIRASSPAACGIWMDMLCLLDVSEERGFLVLGGRAAGPVEVARMVARDRRTVARCLEELERNGVFSRDERGAIYSRRMVSDEKARVTSSNHGAQGGNPALVAEQIGSNPSPDGSRLSQDGDRLRPNGARVLSKTKRLSQKGVNPESEREEEREKRKNPPAADSPREAVATTPSLLPGGDVVPLGPTPTREAFDAWNAMAKRLGLSVAVAYSEARRRKLAARLGECGGLPGWLAMLAQVEASDWLCGRLPGRHWKADLDWIMRPDRFHSVAEGQCATWGKAGAGSSAHEWMAPDRVIHSNYEFDGITLDGKVEGA